MYAGRSKNNTPQIKKNPAVELNVASLEGVIQPVQWLQDEMEQTNERTSFFILIRRSLQQYTSSF